MAAFRLCYGIMSHKAPDQVESLAARIRELSPTAEIAVHHDAKSSERPWRNGQLPPGVHLVDPVEVFWGDWSQVEAQLRLLRCGFTQLGCDWLALLTGEDWPIVDLAKWEQRLQATDTHAIMRLWPLLRPPVFGERPIGELGYARHVYRWRPVPMSSNRPATLVLRAVAKTNRLTEPLIKVEYLSRRSTWFVGSRRSAPWWFAWAGEPYLALTRQAGEFVLKGDPAFTAFCQETLLPDQAYLHALIGGSRLPVELRTLTYHVQNDIVRSGDLPAIRKSGAVFARKFDPSVDPDVRRVIDKEVDDLRISADD